MRKKQEKIEFLVQRDDKLLIPSSVTVSPKRVSSGKINSSKSTTANAFWRNVIANVYVVVTPEVVLDGVYVVGAKIPAAIALLVADDVVDFVLLNALFLSCTESDDEPVFSMIGFTTFVIVIITVVS